ncbi:hypothetical protein PQR05_36935, partial [Paraburkholderia sediminicola]|uniref:hypothetical protein n=1 Tax=Paraburkholderia sediminicola TaxID=458836 RepID=UPI0038BD9E59
QPITIQGKTKKPDQGNSNTTKTQKNKHHTGNQNQKKTQRRRQADKTPPNRPKPNPTIMSAILTRGAS